MDDFPSWIRGIPDILFDAMDLDSGLHIIFIVFQNSVKKYCFHCFSTNQKPRSKLFP
jgi:hypothetical protein